MDYNIDKFEVAFEYIHVCGKKLYDPEYNEWDRNYINCSHSYCIHPLLPFVAETYALPCDGRLFVVREGNIVEASYTTNNYSTINNYGGYMISSSKPFKEILDAITLRAWHYGEEPSAEFNILYDWVIHHWYSIRLVKT